MLDKLLISNTTLKHKERHPLTFNDAASSPHKHAARKQNALILAAAAQQPQFELRDSWCTQKPKDICSNARLQVSEDAWVATINPAAVKLLTRGACDLSQ